MKRRFIHPFQPTWIDYPDNESLAISLYIMGCEHFCKDCSNPDFAYEYYATGTKAFLVTDLYVKLLDACCRNKTNKIVMIGGDFLFYKNISFTKDFLKSYSREFEICIYTGYDIEYVKEHKIIGFKFIKCGCFDTNNRIVSEKTDKYLQLASTNQKLYDMNYKLLSNNGRYYFNKEVLND